MHVSTLASTARQNRWVIASAVVNILIFSKHGSSRNGCEKADIIRLEVKIGAYLDSRLGEDNFHYNGSCRITGEFRIRIQIRIQNPNAELEYRIQNQNTGESRRYQIGGENSSMCGQSRWR